MDKGLSQIWILETVMFKHSGVPEVHRWEVRKAVIFQVKEGNWFPVATADSSMISVFNSTHNFGMHLAIMSSTR